MELSRAYGFPTRRNGNRKGQGLRRPGTYRRQAMCSVCTKTFDGKAARRNHMVEQHFPCHLCGIKCKNEDAAKQHESTPHGTPLVWERKQDRHWLSRSRREARPRRRATCPICSQGLGDKAACRYHLAKQHPWCPIYELEFTEQEAAKQHQAKTHLTLRHGSINGQSTALPGPALAPLPALTQPLSNLCTPLALEANFEDPEIPKMHSDEGFHQPPGDPSDQPQLFTRRNLRAAPANRDADMDERLVRHGL